MSTPSSRSFLTRSGRVLVILGRSMLATIRSNSRSGRRKSSLDATRTLFFLTFSRAFLMAQRSLSTARADRAPSFTAAIARAPVPHPKSRTCPLRFTYSWSKNRQSLVVSWWQVPNDIFGSMCRTILPLSPYRSFFHEGLMRIRSVASTMPACLSHAASNFARQASACHTESRISGIRTENARAMSSAPAQGQGSMPTA